MAQDRIAPSLLKHNGSCHCGAVRFRVVRRPHLRRLYHYTDFKRPTSFTSRWPDDSVPQVYTPDKVQAMDCNCSICKMKRNRHFVVPKSQFELLQGQNNLTLYQFNTKTAQHLFCKTCGVQSFYIPRSNPDGYAVTVGCLEPSTLPHIEVVECDGSNWEEYMAQKGSIMRVSAG